MSRLQWQELWIACSIMCIRPYPDKAPLVTSLPCLVDICDTPKMNTGNQHANSTCHVCHSVRASTCRRIHESCLLWLIQPIIQIRTPKANLLCADCRDTRHIFPQEASKSKLLWLPAFQRPVGTHSAERLQGKSNHPAAY
jgi:hypothetical protein